MRKRTGRIALLGSLVTATALCFGAAATQAATIAVGDASGDPGATVTVSVTLSTDGAMVAGTQNDIGFDADTPIAAKASGKPNCTVNPDIDKGGTAFSFTPSGCSATSSCTGIRALVLALDNTTPIPDGSVLYTCNVDIAATAAGGDHTLANSGVILSDPNGGRITPADGTNGTVTVSGGTLPTPTSPPAACPTPKPSPAGPAIWLNDQEGTAGSSATLTATLATAGAMVAGTQNDIGFPTDAPIAAKASGKPDCTVNPDIDKGGTAFSFTPSGCSATSSCTGIRALVLALDNTTAIPDGSALYTCNVAIGASASGTLAYAVSGVILSDPNGGRIADATGQDGSICIPGPVGPTATPTEVVVPPTATPTTVVVPPTATPTTVVVLPTASPTRTPVPSGNFEDEDGCQIGTVGGNSNAWLLLLPAVGLLVRRRRSR